MKRTSESYWHVCNTGALGTMLHMFWEQLSLSGFWCTIASVSSDVLDTVIVASLFLLNDDFVLQLLYLPAQIT